ncbi:hypothetical protein [Methylobacterium gnaphalii]|uniref:Uncharacterized protein n=1 Tax=Methylobacterium gnaphalii TaxID=1010610 RepID=A0A512JHH1_9HYPH|nr:hypothetical protein [Methylobacterium gnaphalii]GEP09407.1 hypothetical protein MGN01_12520 [Methylobacterium gnaphalii]GJD68112.1 hypothetical protein MMMDOFMJ_1030 [Methylobacterium gnaphalii]GLS49204.1 hypothetical protein GCM10007885_20520 [Methylobacterium gnaphalii]
MSACAPRDPGVEALTVARGSALPFLPTLVTALAVGLLSLLCHTPSAPEAPPLSMVTAAASMTMPGGFHPVLPGSEAMPSVHAAVAFGRLPAPVLEVPQMADVSPAAKAPATQGANRPVRNAARRPCAAPHCADSRRVDTATRNAPVRAASEPEAVPAPMRGRGEVDEDLPTGALPFAATAASWVERVRTIGGSVGNGAASLSGSVVDLLASLR